MNEQIINANASPEKRFFIDLITRDISLEDAILDLFDNSIDSLVRTKNIDLYADIRNESSEINIDDLPSINLKFDKSKFIVEDNCGGISVEAARDEIFRFGHPDQHSSQSLSVFGIGMKRAMFKIGRQILIESRSTSSGFRMNLDVDDWLSETGPNWVIPISRIEPAESLNEAGTRIKITQLKSEVSTLVENRVFNHRLVHTAMETYPFYLNKYMQLLINGKTLPNHDIKFGQSDQIIPASESWKDGNVNIDILCGLLPKTKESWKSENSGWYILCNGRVVVNADKSILTGWGAPLPQFMPKNRGFLGVVFFSSDHPEDLPWKTTKRGVNSENPVFIRTLHKMSNIARPVIQFQNKLFASNDDNKPKQEYRESISHLEARSATETAAQMRLEPQSTIAIAFQVPEAPTTTPIQTRISFNASKEDVIRVKKSLGRKGMSNKEAGEKIFKYYLEREC